MSKVRIRQSEAKFLLKIVGILFLACIPVILVNVLLYNLRASDTFRSIACVVIFILSIIGVTILVLNATLLKGKIGEWRVNRILKRFANKYSGNLIYDVMIPGDEGKTSQIDHILVCTHGLFVVETKNYAGRIYGNAQQHDWTQVLAYGRVKNKLYNPLMQNYTHMRRLKELLPDCPDMIGAVVFVKGNVDYIDADGVYSLRGLKKLIKYSSIAISESQVASIAAAIQHYKDNPVATNKEHVRSIKEAGNKLRSGICPRCGAPLVLRKAKETGSEFYGCSNYPKCKFHTKSLDK